MKFKRSFFLFVTALAGVVAPAFATSSADAPYGYVSSPQALREGTFYYNDFNAYGVDQGAGYVNYVPFGQALIGNSRGSYKMVNPSTGPGSFSSKLGTMIGYTGDNNPSRNSTFDPDRDDGGRGPDFGAEQVGANSFSVKSRVLVFRNGASAWSGSTSRGIQFDISTAGFTDITLSFDFAQAAAGNSGYFLFRMSGDGGATWAFSEVINNIGAATWYSDFNYHLSDYQGLENSGSFVFQMLATPNPETGTFVDVNGNPTGSSPSFAIDRVALSGTAIPEPATVALVLGVAVGAVVWMRRGRAG